MNINRFNNRLRDLLKNLINDGFIERDIASLTFGLNRQSQLKQFFNGQNVGGKPLDRIFESLGFEIHLVPVSRKDLDDIEIVEEITENAFDAMQSMFIDYLENIKQNKKKKSNLINFIDKVIEKANCGETI